MNYLLDTDSIVDYFNNQRGMLALMPSLLPSGIAISILTFIESHAASRSGLLDYAQIFGVRGSMSITEPLIWSLRQRR